MIFKFLVQFGISYTDDPELQKLASTTIPDDPQIPELRKFQVGFVSFAGNGPNTRDSQLFISLSGFFEGLGNEVWETPFGVVVEGMDETVKKLTWEYRQEPSQDRIKSEGKSYIEDHYPNLDHFETCSVKRILVTVNKTMPEHKSAVIIINRFNGGVFYTEKYGAPGKKKKKPVQKDKAASGGGRLGSTVGEHGLWVGGMALLVLFILVLARREVSHQKKQ